MNIQKILESIKPKQICLPKDLKKINAHDDYKIDHVSITGSVCKTFNHKFKNENTLTFSHQNITSKSLKIVLESINAQKIKEIRFLSPQTNSTFSTLTDFFSNTVFETVKFELSKAGSNKHDVPYLMNFVNFIIPHAQEIQNLDIEMFDFFYCKKDCKSNIDEN